MDRRDFLKVAGAATLVPLVGRPAFAAKADRTLNIAWGANFESIDPYYDSTREGVILVRHVYDALLYRDPKTFEYKPLLASAYRWLDDVTLEFDLRQNVKFHNGDPFTADDVVFTFTHVLAPDSGIRVRSTVDWMKSAEKVDKYKVRLHLKGPFPAALDYLAGQLGIYPHAYFAKVGQQGMARAPIGTGPYKVASQVTGKSATLERFADYFEGSPKGKASIGKIFARVIPDQTTQLAELMAGSLDWMWRVSADLLARLEVAPQLKTVTAETMRISMLGFDAAGKAGKSPMQDVRVRRAFAYAINRKSLRDNLIKGNSRVLNASCFPTQFGCTDDVPKYSYHPDRAKKLLAEAGYPDGFEITMLSWADRAQTQAVVGDLAKVGIRVTPRFLQSPVVRKMMSENEAQLTHMTWGSYSVNDVSASAGLFFNFSGYDMARDPEVRDWLHIADTSIDPERRKEYYKKALQRIADQVYWLPLASSVTNYAFTRDLVFEPSVDEIPRFFTARWA